MPARVIRRKLYVINIPPGLPVDKVYEKVSGSIRTPFAEISIRDNRLFVELVGTEAEIKDSWYRIRNAVQDLWELYRLTYEKEASIESIVREAGRTFPPEALVYALKLRGFEARLSEDKQRIYTNASVEIVIELAREIAEVMDQIRFRVKGTAAKRIIAALVAGLSIDVEKVIDYGLKTRVLEESEDGIRLREEWRKGLRKIAVMLKKVALEFE